MKYENKQRLLNYLENGGSVEERKTLIKMMKNTEMGYIDLDCMSVCTDDEGCANLTHEQLETVAMKLQDRLMEDFNSQLAMVLDELDYDKKPIKLNVTIKMKCDDPNFTEADMQGLAKMHVANCIRDNPDAVNCTITSVDVCLDEE